MNNQPAEPLSDFSRTLAGQRLKLTVRYSTPSLNLTRRQHWAEWQKEKKKAFNALLSALQDIAYAPLDPDNFAGSVKDLLDGLRRIRMLDGDEWHRIRLETEQVKVESFKEERTEIELIYP